MRHRLTFALPQNEEDQLLKEKLELLVERLTDRDQAQRTNAVDQLKVEITGATSTMTSVPKPLKFLSPQYAAIKAAYEAQTDASLKVSSALGPPPSGRRPLPAAHQPLTKFRPNAQTWPPSSRWWQARTKTTRRRCGTACWARARSWSAGATSTSAASPARSAPSTRRKSPRRSPSTKSTGSSTRSSPNSSTTMRSPRPWTSCLRSSVSRT